MSTERPAILVVASPSPVTGGGLRALRSLREYAKHFKTSLVIPWMLWDDKETLRKSITHLEELKSLGVELAGFSRLPSTLHWLRKTLGSRTFELIPPLIAPDIVRVHASGRGYTAVVVLHENWDVVYTGRVLADHSNLPSMVLLQLPAFYGSRERLTNIVRALVLWRKLRSSSSVEDVLLESEVIARALTEEHLKKHRVGEALRKYDLVLGVSKAVPIEMGGEWTNRITPLDPGVSLDEKDLELIKHVRGKTREKRDYIVLGGRPSAVKGLAEALVVFRLLSKHFPGLKLVVTGEIPEEAVLRVMMACRRLGIEGKLVFTGFITKEKRFELVAGAKLMLYPSHEDSFSYAVLESLHLGTPVVGYRIPALEIYYGGCLGVELVNEWDLEGLTVKAIDVLERGVDAVEPPRIKSWEEIMSEEVGYVKMLVGNAT